MSQYRKNPVVIEAQQWLGPETPHPQVREYTDVEEPLGERGRYYVQTLENQHFRVTPGDWIICGVKGEYYACKPDIFAATYEPAESGRASLPSEPSEAAVDADAIAKMLLQQMGITVMRGVAPNDALSFFRCVVEIVLAQARAVDGVRAGESEAADWIANLPPDAIASVVNAYRDAYDAYLQASHVGASGVDAHAEGCRWFRDALLAVAPDFGVRAGASPGPWLEAYAMPRNKWVVWRDDGPDANCPEFGAFDTEAEAIAARNALNWLASRVSSPESEET